MENNDDARQALLDVQAARATLAERTTTPPWFRYGFAAVMASFPLAQALPLPASIAVLVLGCAGLGALVGAYRQRSGVVLNGFAAPSVRRWTFAFAAATLAVMLVGAVTDNSLGPWVWLGCAAVLAALTLAVTPLLDQAWTRWLRETQR